MDDELIPIPDFPKYKVRLSDLKVLSYHIYPQGYGIAQQTNKFREKGYRLWDNGESCFFSVDDIREVVDRHKLKGSKLNKLKLGVQTGEWIVGSVDKTTGSFSTNSAPARHASEGLAKAEAARLAGLFKDKKFVVLKVVAIASATEINWE